LPTLVAEKTVQLIDVRSPEEHAAFNIGGMNIPLPQLATSYKQLSAANSIVLYCASGVRSKQAALLLLQNGFTTVMSIRDGVRHLQAV
jgi:rhodanese-related sulfurtransferase